MKKIKNAFLTIYILIICSFMFGCGSKTEEFLTAEDVIVGEDVNKEVIENSVETEEISNIVEEINEDIEIQETTTFEKSTDRLSMVLLKSENQIELTAKGAILIEASTGTILYEKGLNEKIYPASMTKILTALLVLEYFTPEELIEVGREINEVPWDSSKAGHVVGEMITIENLIRALIIPSGNDSANVATVAVAKRYTDDNTLSLEQCEEIFARLMNEKAKDLGAENSNFVRSHGYHDDDHYTTPYDMALITAEFLQNEVLRNIASETQFSGNSANGMFDGNENVVTQDYTWRSHNLLITNNDYNYPYAIGVKTGYTNEAGRCIASASVNNEGEELIAIIFNSTDPERWIDSQNLYEHGYNDYNKTQIGRRNQVHETVELKKHNPVIQNELDLVYNDNYYTYLPTEFNSSEITSNIIYNVDFTQTKKDEIFVVAPVNQGDVIGIAEFFIGDQKIFEADLVAKDDIEKANILNYIQYFFTQLFKKIFTFDTLIGAVVCLFIGLVIMSYTKKSKSKSTRRHGNRRSSNDVYTFKKNKGKRFKK